MIAAVNALATDALPLVPCLYEIDYETGAGVSRQLVTVKRIDRDNDEDDQVVATTLDDCEIVFTYENWERLNPEKFVV